MYRGTCKRCGATFWETYKGARGEDLCDACEELDQTKRDFTIGQEVSVDGRLAVVRRIDGHGIHVEFCDAPDIGTWAHHPNDVAPVLAADEAIRRVRF